MDIFQLMCRLVYPGALLLWHSSSTVASPLLRHPIAIAMASSTAVPEYLLLRLQLAAAIAGPVRIMPQFDSFYTFPIINELKKKYLINITNVI